MTVVQASPPAYLSRKSKAWWRSVVLEYELEPHHVLVLEHACQALDQAESARKVLDHAGPTFVDRFDQPRARPELKIERDSMLLFSRLVKGLGLDAEEKIDRRTLTGRLRAASAARR